MRCPDSQSSKALWEYFRALQFLRITGRPKSIAWILKQSSHLAHQHQKVIINFDQQSSSPENKKEKKKISHWLELDEQFWSWKMEIHTAAQKVCFATFSGRPQINMNRTSINCQVKTYYIISLPSFYPDKHDILQPGEMIVQYDSLVMLIHGQDLFPWPLTLWQPEIIVIAQIKRVFELVTSNHFTNKNRWENFRVGEIPNSRKGEGEK